MHIAIISDIHFGVRNDQPLFLQNQLEFYDNIFFPELERRCIKTVFILGDTWDRRKYININTMHQAKKHFFDRLRDLGVRVYMIYGNHDTFFRNTNEVNSIDFLESEYSNIEVIETYDVKEFDGLKIGFISWINSSNIEAGLDFIRTADCRVLCGHFEIKSFEMVKGTVCEQGFDYKMFSRYEQVFSGHFHVISESSGICYVGNPHQTNWGDYGLKKGFWVFDTSTLEKELVENPYNLYERVIYNDDIDLLKFDYDLYTDKIVRVYIKSFDAVKRKKLDLFLDKLGSKTFSAELVETNRMTDGDIDGDITIETSGDTMSLVDQYLDSVDDRVTVDRVKLRRYFSDIYVEAQERLVAA